MQSIHEPNISPEDTPTHAATEPIEPIKIVEPPPTLEDTQPRPAERRGCGNPLLIGIVAVALLGLFISTVGLAAFAGYRDGQQIADKQKSGTKVAYVDNQATLAGQSLAGGQYEIAEARCEYIVTQQPGYPGMQSCMATAQMALSATPTFTATSTPLPPTFTPTPQAPKGTPTGVPTGMSLTALLELGEKAMLSQDYEKAQQLLEAVRGDPNVDSLLPKVNDDLFQTYMALAAQYKNDESQLSEMVIVIRAAEKIPDHSVDGSWLSEADAAELYLSAKGYLDAGNYPLADKVFITLMDRYPTYRDSSTLSCNAFAKAGDSPSAKKFGC